MKKLILKIFIINILLISCLNVFSLGAFAATISRESLKTTLDSYAFYDEKLYTPKSYVPFKIAILNAKPYTQEGYGTDSDVVQQYTILKNAYVGLQMVANKFILNSSIYNIGFLNQNDFTKESWNNFLEFLAAAKNIATDINSSQSTCDYMQKQLVIAQSKLVKLDGTTCNTPTTKNEAVDKDALIASLYNVGYLDQDKFTFESWLLFQMAVELAEEGLNDPDIIQENVDQMQTDLVSAESSLVKNTTSLFSLPSNLIKTPSDIPDFEEIISSDSSSTSEASSTQEPSASEDTSSSGTSTPPSTTNNILPVVIISSLILGIAVVGIVVFLKLKNKKTIDN